MTAARTLAAIGSVLVILSFFGTYATTGVGSSIDGRRLADLILDGTLAAWVPRWVGASLYLIPLAGAITLLGLGLDGRTGHVLVTTGAATTIAVFVVVTWALDGAPVTSPGSGSLALLAGLACWAASAGVGWKERAR